MAESASERPRKGCHPLIGMCGRAGRRRPYENTAGHRRCSPRVVPQAPSAMVRGDRVAFRTLRSKQGPRRSSKLRLPSDDVDAVELGEGAAAFELLPLHTRTAATGVARGAAVDDSLLRHVQPDVKKSTRFCMLSPASSVSERTLKGHGPSLA